MCGGIKPMMLDSEISSSCEQSVVAIEAAIGGR